MVLPALCRYEGEEIALSEELSNLRVRLDALERGAHPSVKATGLAQKLGQLEAANRDFQSKLWANLQLLGQPCNFRAMHHHRAAALPRPRGIFGLKRQAACARAGKWKQRVFIAPLLTSVRAGRPFFLPKNPPPRPPAPAAALPSQRRHAFEPGEPRGLQEPPGGQRAQRSPVLYLSDHASVSYLYRGLYAGLYERAHILRYFPYYAGPARVRARAVRPHGVPPGG